MIGTKEICALLLAGGMGAGSVVAVQQARPSVQRPATKPKVQKVAQRSVERSSFQECITVAPVGVAELAPILPEQAGDPLTALISTEGQLRGANGGAGGLAGGSGGGGGGGDGPEVLPDPGPLVPGVPAPDTWVMLVAGFGFLGLALRRRPVRADRPDAPPSA